ncbi:hypothetical protein cgp_0461 [Corynebacterium glutamicum MB001]|nr:hypothetical protein cgp_0461 [Corynebacterium glutamicum MB001]ASW13169.1 hypothetical protein cgc1_0461 [Corynebacterium glutamicum]QYO72631.1 hypothetical protein cgisf_0461 [Corynebacterium glutamicum]
MSVPRLQALKTAHKASNILHARLFFSPFHPTPGVCEFPDQLLTTTSSLAAESV